MRIAITGSSSGIGRSVADYLESEGHEIKRVDRNEIPVSSNKLDNQLISEIDSFNGLRLKDDDR